jgi:subfamily B ATP-binding cassette protein HlyB/CyaB
MNIETIPRRSGAFSAVAHAANVHGVQVTAAQLSHQMALGSAVPTAEDLVRAAKFVGLKARIIRNPTAKRLRSIPVPAIFKVHDGTWAVLGVETKPNRYRVVDPVTKMHEELAIEDVLQRINQDVILIAKGRQLDAETLRFGFSWFLPALRRYRLPIIHVLVASFFISLLGLARPLVFQLVIDKVLVSKSYSTLVVVISAMALLAIFEAILKYLRAYALNHTSNRIDVELGARLFAHLIRLPISYFERRAAGVIVTRAREIETVRRFMTDQGLLSAIDLLFIFIFIAVMFLYSATLTWVVILFAPFYVLIGGLMRPAYRRLMKEKFRRWSKGQQLLVECIVGLQTVKAAAVEPIFQKLWEQRLSSYVKTSFQSVMLGTLSQTSVEFVTRISTAVILFIGAQQVISGSLTVGGLVAFLMISNRVTQPIMRTSQLYQSFQQVQVSLEHLADIFDAPVEEHSQAHSTLPPARGKIEIKNVSFRYRPELPLVVTDFNLTIEPGEVIGIVGPSGSGKSTVTKLMQRFYHPTSGEIFIDGVDIATVDPAALRRQLGVVLQENFLFNMSIHENIALARPEMPRPQVIRVAKLAGADEFISKLPQGYDSMIEERGANLSGGQRQRLAIARALATDPAVLILDEATSALDYESERIVRDNMKQIAKGRTVIIIAHRLAAVRGCDRIVGMTNGEIVEIGTHAELLKRPDGLYAHLWGLQAEQSDRVGA